MYTIYTKSSRVEKDLDRLLNKLNITLQKRLWQRLSKNPFPSNSNSAELGKIEKKGGYYCYEITGGDRIIFDIHEQDKLVNILAAGNHDSEMKFLKKYGNRKRK